MVRTTRALAKWDGMQPFPYCVIDRLLEDDEIAEIMDILDDEPVELFQSDLFCFEATLPNTKSTRFSHWQQQFSDALLPVVRQLSNKPVSQIDMRAFAYREGHYLLPHTDHQANLQRQVAYAYYLPSGDIPVGGELELFDGSLENATFTKTVPFRKFSALPNRIILFDVSDVSLHQVCEVTSGLRLSLAGWFYP
jgi:Rps23 Pro-64 3,4-dihydroxylase Tpa1-like proline 4-hydroxylase